MRPNKTELLVRFLEERGVQFSPARTGYQQVRCFGASHPRGDRRKSASIDLTRGRYKCFSCDLSGDVFDLLHTLEGLTYSQALTTLGGVQSPTVATEEVEVWL